VFADGAGEYERDDEQQLPAGGVANPREGIGQNDERGR
jgi:hypothetical protein